MNEIGQCIRCGEAILIHGNRKYCNNGCAREARNEQSKQWKLRNPERVSEAAKRKWERATPLQRERGRVKARIWTRKNRNRVKVYAAKSSKRRQMLVHIAKAFLASMESKDGT